MKTLRTFLPLLILGLVLGEKTTYGDLLGYWPANEGSGETVTNAGGDSNLDGTLNSGTWSGAGGGHTGKAGDYAFELEGSQDSYVDVELVDVEFEEITVTAWLNGSATGDWTGIVQARDGSMPIGIGFRGGSGQLTYTWNNNSSTTYNFNSGLEIPADAWSFVALSLKPEAATLYMGTTGPNGELQEAVNDIEHFVQTNNGTPWFFGRDNCCGTERNSQGLMDDISIWDEALSIEDITKLYEMAASPLTLRGGSAVASIELRSLLSYPPQEISNLVLSSSAISSVVGNLIGFTKTGDLFFELPAGSVDYQLIAGEGDTDNAKLQIGGDDGTEILTAADLSGLAGQALSVRVRGEDESGGEIETTISISVGADSDTDQLLDDWEETLAPGNLATLSGDSDNDEDTLISRQEFALSTNPLKADSDDDGSNDNIEVADGTDPLDADSDDDGLGDGDEKLAASNPLNADTDGDGLKDGAEVNGDPATDPTKDDTDGDGHSDSKELADGTNPLDPNDPGVQLVGYWPADEGSGDVVANAGDDADLDGTANNIEWGEGHTGAQGDFAVELAGAEDSNVSIPQTEIEFQQITITAWVKGVQTGAWSAIMHSRDGSEPMGIGYRAGSGELQYHWNNNNANTYNFGSGLDIPEEEWTFVAVTLAPELATLYRGTTGDDAVLESAANEIDHLVQTNNTEWFIGRDTCCGTERNFQGLVDDVAIWNGALTEDQITGLWDGSLTPLTLNGPGTSFEIIAVNVADGGRSATFTWRSSPGKSYSVEASSDLQGEWVELDDGVESEGTETSFTESNISAETTARYYRVRQE